MSVHWPIIRRCLLNPARIACVDDRKRYRAAEILIGAFHVASAVRERCKTQTLGVLLPTSGAFPIAALAGWMLGKTVVPLNYLLKPEELQYIIDDSGTDTVITVQPMLEHLGAAPIVPNLLRLEDVSFTGVPDLFWPARPDPHDLAVILYTSGTSGRPKGVMLSHHNIRSNIAQFTSFVSFTPDDIFLGVLPQFHSFGLTVLTVTPLSIGCNVIFTARFVPQQILRLIREHRPTIFVAIPSMYNALLRLKSADPADFASFKYVVSGGEPLPQAVFDDFRQRFNITINEGYGLTETSPVTNWCRPQDFRPHSVGKTLPGLSIRIVDPDTGRDLPPNRDGEIRFHGPNVMQGYYKLPEETAKAFDPQGYFRTGDIGRLDHDGHLFITGRLKEMLIVGGENVFPREIEEALNANPAVKDSGVIGYSDPVRGEVPVAFVEMADDQPFDEKSLLQWCRSRLAGYKVPRTIVHIEQLPRNPTGKIMRRDLRARLAELAPSLTRD